MSNADLSWSKEQGVLAVSEGWRLAETIDSGAKQPYFMVATAKSKTVKGFNTDQIAQRFVTERAKTGSKLHQHALSVAMQSQINRKKR